MAKVLRVPQYQIRSCISRIKLGDAKFAGGAAAAFAEGSVYAAVPQKRSIGRPLKDLMVT